MKVTLSPGLRCRPFEPVEMSWDGIADMFKLSATLPVHDRDSWNLMVFGAMSSWNDNTIAPEGLYAGAFDFDDCPNHALWAALDIAKALSPVGLAHTTWKHGVEAPEGTSRGRIIIPFERPIPPHDWANVWHWWEAAFAQVGATIDPACKNIGRRYFLPCTRVVSGGPHNGHHQSIVHLWGEGS
jgi:hypothetical protein